ncbi:hypothetical protein HPG69_005630 [Diceros bicornis minor]|uniref:Kinesin motor domain-containing protein n=1 Tax=Diceros bicornis minor TaxID=77932 RepID=A0A7J7E921_DICBM|nr:hypothetical protein HPG69_005630 [Diceros bicornis minor]
MTSRNRGPIRRGVGEILNFKAGRPGAPQQLQRGVWTAPPSAGRTAGRMAEETAVAVCVRVRPLNSREEALGEYTQVYWKTDNNAIYQVDGSKSFNFDRVFHSNESTKNVYEEIAVPIIDSAIQGYNDNISKNILMFNMSTYAFSIRFS